MAGGKAKHDAYLDALRLLGKQLARRAQRKCELSEASGPLVTVDLLGPPKQPGLEHVLLVTEPIKRMLEGAPVPADEVRYLENSVWSTEPAVRKACEILLLRVDASWAQQALDNLAIMNASTTEE